MKVIENPFILRSTFEALKIVCQYIFAMGILGSSEVPLEAFITLMRHLKKFIMPTLKASNMVDSQDEFTRTRMHNQSMQESQLCKIYI